MSPIPAPTGAKPFIAMASANLQSNPNTTLKHDWLLRGNLPSLP